MWPTCRRVTCSVARERSPTRRSSSSHCARACCARSENAELAVTDFFALRTSSNAKSQYGNLSIDSNTSRSGRGRQAKRQRRNFLQLSGFNCWRALRQDYLLERAGRFKSLPKQNGEQQRRGGCRICGGWPVVRTLSLQSPPGACSCAPGEFGLFGRPRWSRRQ
jgi:hypothetical protein